MDFDCDLIQLDVTNKKNSSHNHVWSQPGFLSCIVSHTKNHLRNKTEQFWKYGQKRGEKNMRTLHPLDVKGALNGLWETEKTRHFILIVWLPNMLHKKSHTSTILQHTFVKTRWIAVCWTILFRHFDSHFHKGEMQMDVFSVATISCQPSLVKFSFWDFSQQCLERLSIFNMNYSYYFIGCAYLS